MKYEFAYCIFISEDIHSAQTTEVSFFRKDIADLEKWLAENNYPWQLEDLPKYYSEKFVNQAVAHSRKVMRAEKCTADYSIAITKEIPASLFKALAPDTQVKIINNVPDEYIQLKNRILQTLEKDKKASSHSEADEEQTIRIKVTLTQLAKITSGYTKEIRQPLSPENYKQYLKTDANGNAFFYPDKISPDNPLCGDLDIWNDGVYPYAPANIGKIEFFTGTDAAAKTGTVLVRDIRFEPATTDGKPDRFFDMNGNNIYSAGGDLCHWDIIFHLGEMI